MVQTKRKLHEASVSFCLLVLLSLGCADPQKPQGTPVAASPEELVEQFGKAYFSMDLDWFSSLLADGTDAPMYRFVTTSGSGPQEIWDYEEEIRLHQRMFRPDEKIPGQTPLPSEYRVREIIGALTQETSFAERMDLYVSPTNPDGLSPMRWKAMDAVYGTDVLWDLEGEIDYQVIARASFVVLEDLEKELGDSGKFLILQWQDLSNNLAVVSVEASSWGSVKQLYR